MISREGAYVNIAASPPGPRLASVSRRPGRIFCGLAPTTWLDAKSMALDTVQELRTHAMEALAAARDPLALDGWRIEYLGRKGRLTGVLRGLAELSIDE